MDVIEPMLAVSGGLPDDPENWALELKWDGVRALAEVAFGEVRVYARRGVLITSTYPELSALADLLAGHRAVLDGEVVAFADGKPSFERLQRRMHVPHPPPRLVRSVPVRYVVFDLLKLDGMSLLDLPYVQRRALLEDLELAAGPIEVPPYLPAADREQVEELLAYTAQEELEGLIAKRLDSRYRPGRRVADWQKIKNFRSQEVVVVGWRPGQGRREGTLGSLLLGVHVRGRLRYAGHVGTGFDDAMLDDLTARLGPLERPDWPCEGDPPWEVARDAHWVEPVLVGEVAFTEWTADGRVRHPSWRGLRSDKDPREVIALREGAA
ncbi:non-homologous end-joining DNA ligase [Actinocorallia sp. B10E7]|uniref:non-homologous end-joining DNA ligase n=1 Tax=Actinocorallia sp. B10E7 TaxID=3153558 RepID=UPI00325D0BC3